MLSMSWKKKGGQNKSKIIQLHFGIWTGLMPPNIYSTLGLACQLLSNLQFRFPFGARVALQELRLVVNDGLYISFCICTKGSQKAQCRSAKIEMVFCTFRGSGSWNDLQQEVTHWDFQNWSAWMGANRSKCLCFDYVWFGNHGAALELTCLAEKRIQLCGSQTKAGSRPSSLEHGQSELMSACIHPWSRGVEVVFNVTARILLLYIPGLNKHHAYEPGLWVCLDQNKWCVGCSREHQLKAVEEKRTLEFLKHFENLG